MQSKSAFAVRRFFKRLSVRAGLFAVMAIIAALSAVALAPYVPKRFSDLVGGPAVDNVLTIIASSMLAVVTFSLSVMVSSYATAATSTTPRAIQLLMDDSRAQNALSAFLGAFIYSVVALVALGTGYYGAAGRVILFGTTTVIIIMIVWTMIRWIDRLSNLGRVSQTILRIEEATTKAFKLRVHSPTLGCKSYATLPPSLEPVHSNEVGYVQTIDLRALSSVAVKHGVDVYIAADTGTFVHLKSIVAYLSKGPSHDGLDDAAINDCFVVGNTRTFEDDPRYGLRVLSEVASRALSPAINDPGTAIDIISSATRVISTWNQEQKDCDDTVTYPNLYAQNLQAAALLNDAFDPIARDGADKVEVCIRLQEALGALAVLGNPELRHASKELGERSLARCKLGMSLQEDFDQTKAAALAAFGIESK